LPIVPNLKRDFGLLTKSLWSAPGLRGDCQETVIGRKIGVHYPEGEIPRLRFRLLAERNG
jgi:hypothetical protein